MNITVESKDLTAKQFLEAYFNNPQRSEDDSANALHRFKLALEVLPEACPFIENGDSARLLSFLHEVGATARIISEVMRLKMEAVTRAQENIQQLGRPLKASPEASYRLGYAQAEYREAQLDAKVYKDLYFDPGWKRIAAFTVLENHLENMLAKEESEIQRVKQLIRKSSIVIEVSRALRERRPYIKFENSFHDLELFTSFNRGVQDLDSAKLKRYLEKIEKS